MVNQILTNVFSIVILAFVLCYEIYQQKVSSGWTRRKKTNDVRFETVLIYNKHKKKNRNHCSVSPTAE